MHVGRPAAAGWLEGIVYIYILLLGLRSASHWHRSSRLHRPPRGRQHLPIASGLQAEAEAMQAQTKRTNIMRSAEKKGQIAAVIKSETPLPRPKTAAVEGEARAACSLFSRLRRRHS